MAVFRKSKKLGPLRLTATSKGLSLSGGVKGARVSANTKGEVRRTLSVPGAGIYDTKRISGGGKASRSTRTEAARTQVTYVEAVGGSRDLREGQDGVVTAKVVGLTDTIWNVASFAGVQPMEYGGIHGIRDAILMPDTDQYTVILLVLPVDNPAQFSKKEAKSGEPRGVPLGRLGKADANKWAEAFAGRSIRVVVYLEAKPGTSGSAQVRFRPDLLQEDDESAREVAPEEPPLPSAGWFSDPRGEADLRWWDGSQWTENTHQNSM